jgi:hypothetical protein
MPGSTDCVINLAHEPSEDIRIEIIRNPSGTPSTNDVVLVDQENWDLKFLSTRLLNVEIKLVSYTDILIDDKKAIKRVYEYPIVDPATYKVKGTWYICQILVLNDNDEYYFEMRTEVADEFDTYLEVAEHIAGSINFNK